MRIWRAHPASAVLYGGLEGTFPYTHAMSVSSKIQKSAQGEAQPFLKPSGPSFRMNLYKARGIKPNLLITFRFLLGSVSLPFFVSSECIFGRGRGSSVVHGVY